MRIRILGQLDIRSLAGEPIRLPTRKTSLLLAALVLSRDKRARREILCAAFWPDRAEAQARGSLRQALAAIRRALSDEGDTAIDIGGDLETVQLVARPEEADVWLYDRLIERNDPVDLARAADLYKGDLLASVSLPEPLAQWFAPHQRAYRRKALLLAERLSLLQSSDEKINPVCQALAERLLSTDPAAEEAHRALIRLYQHQGRMNTAVRQFELCKEALQRELGVEPEAQTRALVETDRRSHGLVGDATPSRPQAETLPAASAGPARNRDQPSVVVMPFDNLSGDADGYFVDGVVEEITAALSRIREFFVIARQSAFAYKGRFVDVREVGRQLSVSYVVEGTVRRSGDRMRISVQLVDAETRQQLWSNRYEGITTDVFEFQDRIAAQVAGAIHPALRNAEIALAKGKPPTSLGAYDLVMRAYPKLWGHNRAANDEAIALLQEAIKIDGAYGRAHALLAWCHSLKVTYVWSSAPQQERASTLREVDAACGSINDDPTALTAVGAALSMCGDQERAIAFFERALVLDPNNAWAWTRFGWAAIYRGELDRAKERFERAMALSPVDPLAFNMRMGIAVTMAIAGRVSEALEIVRDVINKHPEATWCYRQLAAWSVWNGDLKTARWAAQRLLAAQPDFTIELFSALPIAQEISNYANRMAEGLRLAGVPEK